MLLEMLNAWRKTGVCKSAGLLIFLVVSVILLSSDSQAAEYISLAAVGDIMMGSTYPAHRLPPEDGRHIFQGAKKELAAGNDIVLGNLEGPLYDYGIPVKCEGRSPDSCREFKTPTRYVHYLKDSGFNVLNIANNHMSDFGSQGAENTVQTLRKAAIFPSGGNTVAQFYVKGKKVAVVGFFISSSSYAYSFIDTAKAARIVSELKKKNDLVIVSFHGGCEGASAQHIPYGEESCFGENRGDVMKFSRSAVDAGADAVIGHGPHVLRAMELYKGKLIAYSLGNFLTYRLFNISGPSGLSVILKAKLDPGTGNFVEGKLVPVKLVRGGVPEVDPDRNAIKLIRQLTADDLRNPHIRISANGLIRLSFPRGGDTVAENAGHQPWLARLYVSWKEFKKKGRSIVTCLYER